MSDLADFREAKDHFFRYDPQSPLTAEQKKTFQGLVYYPEKPELDLELPLERYVEPVKVTMQTSTGDVQDYRQIGQIRFRVGEGEAALQVYEADLGAYLFLPFVDATAPQETYGAGRYLEPEVIAPNMVRVDFNLAYNPYCAYNENWSCPIPPRENRLKVRIEAGEKNYK